MFLKKKSFYTVAGAFPKSPIFIESVKLSASNLNIDFSVIFIFYIRIEIVQTAWFVILNKSLTF